MAKEKIGRNITFPIYNEDGTSFHGLVLKKAVVDSVVMSLGDKITGDVYYKDNTLDVTMKEYVVYKKNPEDENEDGVKYILVSPPTVVREGMVADNSELKGMTKYSFVFYHPMYALNNIPFSDVAVSSNEERFLSQDKEFSWIGYPDDYIAKINKNLQYTQWTTEKSSRFPAGKDTILSEVLQFSKNTIADALKTWYDTWEIPYVIDVVKSGEQGYSNGKRFKIVFGLPSNEIHTEQDPNMPFVFRLGKGVGLKNNSRTPRNNKIITRISGYGSESNIPYGYPQIIWNGNQEWEYTINNASGMQTVTIDGVQVQAMSYPIYDGIVGGQKVRLIKHPFTRTHLMPSIYRETVDKKVNPLNPNYNPNGEIIDYYDAIPTQEFPYPNAIDPASPSYEIHQFEDIKPEMNVGGNDVMIVGAVPLNADLTPADAWNDSIDDDGNFIQSYFRMDLPVLSFDIYACASITQEMSINMRSGACIGCTFNVQVDWEDYKKNFYNSDGVFDSVIHTESGDGHVRDGAKYPDSSQTAISLVVQKDNETFGTIMPNVYQIPTQGDKFVVLGISLPSEYITSAEQVLDNESKSYMLENNVHYYDYPLKFDEHFLATNTYILSQVKPNAVVHFAFGNIAQPLELYVKQLTIKYGYGALPQYDITLTDNIEVVLNQIGQVADDVERLSSVISILRETYSRNVWAELSKKLSKTNNDTAYGKITFEKDATFKDGFGSNNFSSGELGAGYHMGKYGNTNDSYLEIDRLLVRKMAYFVELAVKRLSHVGGSIMVSPADLTISNVEVLDDVYRCYVDLTDGHSTINISEWEEGDLARCQTFNVNQATYYWRAVENVDYVNGYVDLSIEDCDEGSGIPKRGDVLVVVGNKTDSTRQNAIEISSTGSSSPSIKIYHGIDDYSLDEKDATSFEYDPTTGRMKMVVYGDMYVGNREGTNYIKYDQTNGVQIRANAISMKVTEQGQDVYKGIEEIIEEISQQGDGSFIVWRSETDDEPSSESEPESEWTTDEVRDEHVGDIYLNSEGLCWEYKYNPVSGYFWDIVSDQYLIESLRKVREKARCFAGTYGTDTPTSGEYSKNDLWVKASYSTTYTNDLLVCIRNGSWDNFSITDWALAANYSAEIQDALDAINDFKDEVQAQVDGKADSYYQSTDPSESWTDVSQHVGDLWYNTSTKTSSVWGLDETDNEYKWIESSVDLTPFMQKYDRKASIFYGTPTVPYNAHDFWITDAETTTIVYQDGSKTYERGTILVSLATRTDSFHDTDWVDILKYTDGKALQMFINNEYRPFVQDVSEQLDGVAESYITTSSTDPSTNWTSEEKANHKGDIWVQENTGLSFYWTGARWIQSSISLSELTDKTDGKATIFVSQPNQKRTNADGEIIDDGYLYRKNDLWILSADTTLNGTLYEEGTIMVATASNNTDTFNQAHWVKKDCYTNGMNEDDKDALLDAGIDIVNGEIIATSDRFKFQNRQGTEVAVFEEVGGKGYLRTDMINASEIITQTVVATDVNGNVLSKYNGNGNGTVVYYYPPETDGSGNLLPQQKMKEDVFIFNSSGVITGMRTYYYNTDGSVAWYITETGVITNTLAYYWESLGSRGVVVTSSATAYSTLASAVSNGQWATKVPTTSARQISVFHADSTNPSTIRQYDGLTCYGNYDNESPTDSTVAANHVTGYVSYETTVQTDARFVNASGQMRKGYHFGFYNNGYCDAPDAYFACIDGTVWDNESEEQLV